MTYVFSRIELKAQLSHEKMVFFHPLAILNVQSSVFAWRVAATVSGATARLDLLGTNGDEGENVA